MVFFNVAAYTDRGLKQKNEDRILVKLGEARSGEFGMFAVADGMGGLSGGDMASMLAVRRLITWWDNSLGEIITRRGNKLEDISKSLDILFQEVNKEIIRWGANNGSAGGTTLTVLFLIEGSYIVKHVGDSRVFFINGGIRQITADQTLVADQVRKGLINKETARIHPGRNILTGGLGNGGEINVFSISGSLREFDTALLCSDGFYNHINEEEIPPLLKMACRGLDMAAEKLVLTAKERGAYDNISVILVRKIHKRYLSFWGKRF